MTENIEAVSEEKVEIPVREIRALFLDEVEPERVDVPGHEGCWFELKPMDKFAKDKYLESGQTIHIERGKDEQGQADVSIHEAEKNVTLVVETVQDYCLRYPKKTREGDIVHEEMRPPKTAKERRRNLEMLYRGNGIKLHPDLLEWLIAECKRVNGLTDNDLEN